MQILNDDVLKVIFNNLKIENILQLIFVCSRFNDIITNDIFWITKNIKIKYEKIRQNYQLMNKIKKIKKIKEYAIENINYIIHLQFINNGKYICVTDDLYKKIVFDNNFN